VRTAVFLGPLESPVPTHFVVLIEEKGILDEFCLAREVGVNGVFRDELRRI
jgi:hypothetical protein